MCRYEYFYFSTCKHHGIEINAYCPDALFQGGWRGSLKLCRPEIFNAPPPGESNKYCWIPRIKWENIPGWCRECVEKYSLSPTDLPKTKFYEAYPMGEWSENDRAPYIFVPSHQASIPELLGCELHFTEKEIWQGFNVYFPWRTETGTWKEYFDSLPWESKGMWSLDFPGRSIRDVHIELNLQYGVSEGDIEWLAEVHARKPGMLEWMNECRPEFVARGMPPYQIQSLFYAPFFHPGAPANAVHTLPVAEFRVGPKDRSEDEYMITTEAMTAAAAGQEQPAAGFGSGVTSL